MIMITNLMMIYCCCDYVIKVLAFIQKEPFTNSKVGSVAALATLSLNLICCSCKDDCFAVCKSATCTFSLKEYFEVKSCVKGLLWETINDSC